MSYYNALTKKEYSANNTQLIHEDAQLKGIEDLEVAGYRQWNDLGRCVKKGEHGTTIYMVVTKKEKNKRTGKVEDKKVMKRRTVFFKSQTEELKVN